MLTGKQPCTIRDFMNYLIYVERSAENLQFFLWHRDYSRRFADAKTPDIALAHEWTQTMEDDALTRVKEAQAEQARQAPKESTGIFKGTDFEKEPAVTGDKSQFVAPETQYDIETVLTKTPTSTAALPPKHLPQQA